MVMIYKNFDTHYIAVRTCIVIYELSSITISLCNPYTVFSTIYFVKMKHYISIAICKPKHIVFKY